MRRSSGQSRNAFEHTRDLCTIHSEPGRVKDNLLAYKSEICLKVHPAIHLYYLERLRSSQRNSGRVASLSGR